MSKLSRGGSGIIAMLYPRPNTGAARTLTVLSDGEPIPAVMWPALLDGDAATLALVALEAPHRPLESADVVLSHVIRAASDMALSIADRKLLQIVEAFEQEIVTTSDYGAARARSGPHTLNFAANGSAGVEVIDVFEPRRRN